MRRTARPIRILLGCLIAGVALSWTPAPTRGAQAPERRVVEVVVKRYEFVPASIDAVQGEPLRVVVTSGDGLHGFGIKRFNISKEVPRGATVTIDFTPDAAGEFPILCTEYCGDGHERMKGTLVVKAS